MIRTWTPESDTPAQTDVVDYRTVKAWFQQCRDLAAAVETQQQKIRRIRDAAEKCTQNLSGMPGGGNTGDKVGDSVADIDTERRQLEKMMKDLFFLRCEAIQRAYFGVNDAATLRQADCIRMFYIENKRQPQIVISLNLCENSEVSKIIRRGCERLALLWQEFN